MVFVPSFHVSQTVLDDLYTAIDEHNTLQDQLYQLRQTIAAIKNNTPDGTPYSIKDPTYLSKDLVQSLPSSQEVVARTREIRGKNARLKIRRRELTEAKDCYFEQMTQAGEMGMW